MASQRYIQVSQFLKREHYHIQEKWVKECIDYYVSQNNNISIQQLQNEVQQQWLLLNLRDLKLAVLPPNLKDQTKTILSGKYVLQVDLMWDCSQSKYSQWQTLQKVQIENVIATKKPTEDSPARRCLRMTVTDGVQELAAMEYDIIPSLKLSDPNLTPGFKILVTGPVTCRKGILMLKSENVKVLGGEVDTMAKSHSLPVFLANSLGLDVNIDECFSLSRGNAEISPVDDIFDDFNDDFNVDEIDAIENHVVTLQPSLDIASPINSKGSSSVEVERIENQIESNEFTNFVRDNALSTLSGVTPNKYNPSTIRKQVSMESYLRPNITSEKRSTLQPITVDRSPFVYLSQIVALNFDKATDFKIKAFILTLKTKISVKNDEFTLQARICDGTASLDVVISTEILESLLGFSPCEQAVLMREKSQNPVVAERLKKAFASMQKKLISLNAIMTVRFFNNKAMAKVLDVEELEQRHFQQLSGRKLGILN